jgi:hypothetical protein
MFCLLWNLKFHYHVYRSMPGVPALIQMDLAHTTKLYFFTILSYVHLQGSCKMQLLARSCPSADSTCWIKQLSSHQIKFYENASYRLSLQFVNIYYFWLKWGEKIRNVLHEDPCTLMINFFTTVIIFITVIMFTLFTSITKVITVAMATYICQKCFARQTFHNLWSCPLTDVKVSM